MKKQLFSVVAAVAMCSAVALGQGGPGGPGGPMQGPGMRQGMHMQGRMGGPMGGRMMWRHHRMGMGPFWMNPEVAQKLGLSEQQQQQLQKISQDARLKMIDLHADLEREQVILHPMMQTYHPNEAQVLAQVAKVSQARAALQRERVQTMLATQNVLTEAQWTKLREMRTQFRHTFVRRRGTMRRPMMPQRAMPPSK